MTSRERLRLYLAFTLAAYAAAFVVLAIGPRGRWGGGIALVWVIAAVVFKMNALKAYKDLHR